jgi:glutathione S-transferase
VIKLIVGNINYSSWSIRPWFLLHEAGVPFEETVLDMASSDFAEEVARHSPSRRVPCLVLDDGDRVWDSLAIGEALAEILEPGRVWPEDASMRRLARSACAEMHSSYMELRRVFTHNVRRVYDAPVVAGLLAEPAVRDAVHADVARIHELWSTMLEKSGGPFLCGSTFTFADAFFAPVVSRFRTYRVESPGPLARYRTTIEDLATWKRWLDRAHAEKWVMEKYEYAPAA